MNSNRYGGGDSSVTGTNLIGGVSDRQRVRLRYNMQSAVTSIVTTGAFSYVFRGNSVFDPDFTSTGGQPTNFDDWSALFGNYRVWGSTIEVRLIPTLSGSEPVQWVLGPRHTSTSISSATQPDFATQPYVRRYQSNIYRAGAPDSTIVMNMSTRKFLGYTRSEFEGADDLTAAVGANPVRQWYWHISATNFDVSVTSEVAIDVTVTYDVEFFFRVDTGLDAVSRIKRHVSLTQAFITSQSDKKENKGRHSGRVEDPHSALQEVLNELTVNPRATPASLLDKKSVASDVVTRSEPESPVIVTRPAQLSIPTAALPGLAEPPTLSRRPRVL